MMYGNQIINYPKKTVQPTIISFVGKRQTHTLSSTPSCITNFPLSYRSTVSEGKLFYSLILQDLIASRLDKPIFRKKQAVIFLRICTYLKG